MRIFSLITAIVVAAGLYLMVFERERVLDFAQSGAFAAATGSAPEATAETSPEAEVELAETSANSDVSDEDDRVVSVVALKSTAQTVDSAVVLRGRTEAARRVDVRAETSGLVSSEPLRKGAYVEKGQTMCEIAPGTRLTALVEAEARLPEAEARLAEARARVEEAEIKDQQAEKLSQGGFASETRVIEARAAMKSAAAGVEAALASVEAAEAFIATARKEIDKLTVAAPFSGLLETDTAELGSLMQPGALCASIILLDPIKIVGFVPETEVDKVVVGANAGARLTSGREVVGEVTFLSRSADPETRTFRVELSVPNPDKAIRDGQTAEILISAEGQPAHLIPASALTLDNSGTLGVRTAKDDVARFMPIQLLRDTVDGVWVSGLDDNTDIIVVGQEYVIDGVRIKVTYQEP